MIATNIAGTGELVESGQTGILVRPSDVAALAEAMVTMITDHDLRLQLSERGRRRVVEEFDIDRETAKLMRCFRARIHETSNVDA